MKELESCRVREVGVVCMATQAFIGICSILEGQIGGKIPESTLKLLLVDISALC